MADELKVNPATAVDRVGRSGIYPASGPMPVGNAPLRGQGELAHPEERRRDAAGPWGGNTAMLNVGRVLYGGYFLSQGINHFRQRKQMTEYVRSQQVPRPALAVLGSGALMIAGALSLLTGRRPRVGALMIAGFLLGVSPWMHAFWKDRDEQQRMSNLTNFLKNMALVGGAGLAAALPEPWPALVGASNKR